MTDRIHFRGQVLVGGAGHRGRWESTFRACGRAATRQTKPRSSWGFWKISSIEHWICGLRISRGRSLSPVDLQRLWRGGERRHDDASARRTVGDSRHADVPGRGTWRFGRSRKFPLHQRLREYRTVGPCRLRDCLTSFFCRVDLATGNLQRTASFR